MSIAYFWSKEHEQRALHEAYQSGRSDGYEEGKRMGELEARAIIRDFMVNRLFSYHPPLHTHETFNESIAIFLKTITIDLYG